MILREPANALDPRVRRYWLVQGLLATGVVALLVVAGAVVAAVLDATIVAWLVGGIGALAVIVLAVLAVVAANLDYRHFHYEVTDLGLAVERGWLWRHYQVVPHARVQTVDTTAGPLMRTHGLVSVDVRTASAAGGTSIPGLPPQVADRLVEELALRAGLEEGT
ncbi:MAG: PH domain-containing protein [Gaiellaceae bacterium]